MMKAEVYIRTNADDTAEVLVKLPKMMLYRARLFDGPNRLAYAAIFADGVVSTLRALDYEVDDPTL